MNMIVNNPDYVVEDMLKGFAAANSDIIAPTSNPRVFKYVGAPVEGKVGLVTGGGSGHKPAFIGYVGKNMCDAVACGEIFASPSAKAFEDAIEAADSGKGVAVLYGNYAGDNMNVKMAMRAAAKKGITVKTVVANDDVPSASPDEREKRRGVAGEILMWKVAGAKAAMGGTLDEVIAAAQKAIDNTRSVGIGTAPCTIPSNGVPTFQIAEGTMEVGVGHHGESGMAVKPLGTANEMAEEMLNIILPDLPFKEGDEVVTLLSGLGATPVMEQYIVYGRVDEILKEKGIKVYKSYVGNYFTSLEMKGVTLTLMKLDDELKEYIDLPCDSVGLKQLPLAGAAQETLQKQASVVKHTAAEEGAAAKAAPETKRVVSGASFKNTNAGSIVLDLIKTIQTNKDYLCEVDSKIGDGDHGLNMNKGFTMTEERLAGTTYNLSQGLSVLSQTLMEDIGGSMGPLYGVFFDEMGMACENAEDIDAAVFKDMINNAVDGVMNIGGAKPGDKCLLDAMDPARKAYNAALDAGKDFAAALEDMKAAAKAGWQATEGMVAKIGRASRHGEKSRGILDAGATSAYLMLTSIGSSIQGLIK